MLRTVLRLGFFIVALALLPTAASAEKMPESAWRSTSFEGYDLWYQDIGREDAQTLVFVHGWSCDASVWEEQIAPFANEYRLIIVDLPGFGRSAKPQDATYSMEYFARALHTVMESAGLEQPVLIGHSMGYAVVRQYVLEFSEKASALVNVDGAFFRIPDTPEELAAFEKNAETFLVDFEGPKRADAVRTFIEETFYGQTQEPVRTAMLSLMTKADAYAATSSLREMFTLEQWQDQPIEIPALVVYAKSPHVENDQEAYFKSLFPNLRTYALWNDTGHYLMLEQPERFNTLLRAFLKGLSQ